MTIKVSLTMSPGVTASQIIDGRPVPDRKFSSKVAELVNPSIGEGGPVLAAWLSCTSRER